MIAAEWATVADRLATLSAHPHAGTVFGANGHRWRIEPPLEPAELDELQSQANVALPAEYRDYLVQVGRGGAGPAYGLFPLRRVDDRWRWEGDGAELTDPGTLAEPFPHTDAFDPGAGLPEPPREEDFGSPEEFEEAEEAYWEGYDAVVYAPANSVGLVYLSHRGCALRDVLVVSGPARGQMWADDTADGGGFRPLLDSDRSRMGFGRWYRRWLESAEESLPRL